MSSQFSFTRRQLMRTAGAGAALLAPASRAFAAKSSGLTALAEEAYIWGFPLVLTGEYLKLARTQGFTFNQYYVSNVLSNAASKLPGPNVDTLYGFSWLDLSGGPQILQVPDARGRYYSLMFIDAYGNVFTYVGRRATGTQKGAYALVGPGWRGTLPPGVHRIDAPDNQLLSLTRTLVSGDADLAAANAVQNQFTLSSLTEYPDKLRAPIASEAPLSQVLPFIDLTKLGPGYFDAIGDHLLAAPPSVGDAAHLRKFARLGLGPGKHPSQSGSAAVTTALSAAIPLADKRIKSTSLASKVNGWTVDYRITSKIEDPLARAANNVFGPGANVADEALYFMANKGSDGQPLSGQSRYALRFPPGQTPPVDAFWSLTLYDAKTFFLVANPLNRYAITDRTEGLVKADDGSLVIRIQSDAPTEKNVNWLPAPAGAFQLILRTYQPGPALLDRSYKLPPLQQV